MTMALSLPEVNVEKIADNVLSYRGICSYQKNRLFEQKAEIKTFSFTMHKISVHW